MGEKTFKTSEFLRENERDRVRYGPIDYQLSTRTVAIFKLLSYGHQSSFIVHNLLITLVEI